MPLLCASSGLSFAAAAAVRSFGLQPKAFWCADYAPKAEAADLKCAWYPIIKKPGELAERLPHDFHATYGTFT